MMIKITRIEPREEMILRLTFSDGRQADLDFRRLLEHRTGLTEALRDPAFFRKAFVDFGALCRPHGLELSHESLYRKAFGEAPQSPELAA